jgi:rubrerythrin
MGAWTLDDIPWHRFDRAKLNPEHLSIIKTACLIEQNVVNSARYLRGVFDDDTALLEGVDHWEADEIQHGLALGRWTMLADPGFEPVAAWARYSHGFPIGIEANASLRYSRAGELVARCIIETATNTYYTALGEVSDEPVLQAICQRIAADEFRHYKLFYSHLKRYLLTERMCIWARLKVAAGRIAESEDDELAYAYYSANENDASYDRARFRQAYAHGTYSIYRWHHVERGAAMIFKAVGLRPHGRLSLWAAQIAWWCMRRRVERLRHRAAHA